MSIDRRRLIALTGVAAAENATRFFATMDSQTALAAYAALLFGLIHEGRDLGRPGARPFFILESGLAYVQALAGDAGSPIRFEAVSAKSVPAMAAVLNPAKLRRLRELGFQSPVEGRSPNHWRDVDINEPGDFEQAGSVAAAVLTDVFDVKDAGAIDTFVRIPRLRVLKLRNSGTSAAGPGNALESRWRRFVR
jgi:hypothetical protein